MRHLKESISPFLLLAFEKIYLCRSSLFGSAYSMMAQEFDYLLIDISNSFTKIVLSSSESLGDSIITIPTYEINEKTLGDLLRDSNNADLSVILSSVVPALNS